MNVRTQNRQTRSLFLTIASLVATVSIGTMSFGQARESWAPKAGETSAKASPISSNSSTSNVAQTGRLPNDQGQVWQEYDIRAYTQRIRDTDRPEQAVIDWILRETGTDTWFGEPLSLLSANSSVVRAYHTPQVQEIVKGVVERFVSTRGEANEVAVRLVTIDSPNWRAKALPMLTPVQTQTQGIEAWLVSRENAALLISELSRRTDFREHNTSNLTIYSGQTHMINSTRPRTYSRSVSSGGNLGADNIGQVEEGFSLQISPLVAGDGKTIEAVVKCNVEQIEKFTPLWIHTPDAYGTPQRWQIQVPQLSSWQLHERFRWPVDEVLLISRGLVATPGPATNRAGLSRLFDGGNAPRSNALLFLESRSEIRSAARPQRMASGIPDANYRGRY